MARLFRKRPQTPTALTWFGILRLGLVQTSLAAIIVLMTSTINRVLIVEIGLPAFVPGLLVAGHYAVQILRPAWGYGSDRGGRRTPWIITGMGMLAIGGIGAAFATNVVASHLTLGLLIAVISFLLLGIGAGAAGTSVLAMLATNVSTQRRPAAATIVWVMMILGFAITAPVAGHFLDPFSQARLLGVTASVALIAFLLATCAIYGLESSLLPVGVTAGQAQESGNFSHALRGVWQDPAARRLTIFIFVSMLAYSAQELVLEPFAGVVFALTPGGSTKLSGVQHGGVLVGMLCVGGLTTLVRGSRFNHPRAWTIGGCVASSVALAAIAIGGLSGPAFPLRSAVFVLGLSNGVFAVSAIAMMMTLAGGRGGAGAGTRMGVWGAAQAIAFALGGFASTLGVTVARRLIEAPAAAYGAVFLGEALLFLVATALAVRVTHTETSQSNTLRNGILGKPKPFRLALERQRL